VELAVHRRVRADAADDLWGVYERAFQELRAQAVQRHLLTRKEFEEILADERVGKYVVTDPARGGAACGLATLTNELSAVSLISPDYFAARWPELYDDRLIWYVGFLAVDPDYQGTGAIARLIGRLCAEVASTGGVIAADICEFNEEAMRLPTAFARLGRTFSPGLKQQRLDAQVYWAYEFPTPA
jgi:GNAT superfamily N-acetyltransferase